MGNTGHRDTIHTFRCARFLQQRLCCDNQGKEESGIMPVINTMKNESWNGVSRDEKNRESVNDSNYSDTDGRHCRLCPDAERNP